MDIRRQWTARLYALVCILCPLAASARGDQFQSRLLLYIAAPLSAASMAMAFASRWEPATRVSFSLALCWVCAAPGLCVSLPADPYAAFLVLASTRAALVATTSVLLLTEAIAAIRASEVRLTRLPHGGGLALLGLLFARDSLTDFVVIYAEKSPAWAGTLTEELRLFCAVTAISTLAIAAAAVVARARNTGLLTTGPTR